MPRKPKQGIDFAGWSVNMFDGDKKIDKLLDAQGWKGFGVYFFLCQSAYKLNGYYLEWGYDDSATTARRMGGGVTSQTVEETVRFCLLTGLFDEVLFDRWNVLTSKGIQRRFWVVAGERRVVPLHKKYWLLSPEEAEGLDKVARFDDLSPTNSGLSPTNADLHPRNVHRTIVEGTIAKDSKGEDVERARELRRLLIPSRDEVRAFAKERHSKSDPDRFFDWYEAADWRDGNGELVRNWKQKFMTWERLDDGGNNTGHPGPSQRSTERDFNVRYDNQSD